MNSCPFKILAIWNEMEIHLSDINNNCLPPEDVRIRELSAVPWSDGRRVSVYLELDPSQRHPNADLQIKDNNGQIIAATSIIEIIERKVELTMHLPSEQTGGRYQLCVTLFFAEIPEDPESDQDQELVKITIVDDRQIWFEISA